MAGWNSSSRIIILPFPLIISGIRRIKIKSLRIFFNVRNRLIVQGGNTRELLAFKEFETCATAG